MLLLNDRLVHSLTTGIFPSRLLQHGVSVSSATSQRRRRTCNNMIMSDQRGDDDTAPRGSTSPVKAVLSSLLAATVVLTGVVPGLEVRSTSTLERKAAVAVATTTSVPSASAATFNTEQAAVAETWVSLESSCHFALCCWEACS